MSPTASPPHTPTATWLPVSRGNISVTHATPDTIHTHVAEDIAKRLDKAIQHKGKAVLSVSGGKSPVAMFEALRVQTIDWSKVTITLVDERCVPNSHPDSNAHLVTTHLLQGPAQKAMFMPMVTASIDLADVSQQAMWASAQLKTTDPTDVLVLGLGADGHIASLFPDAPNLAQALDLNNRQVCMGITLNHPPANAPYARITQTLAHLLTAGHIVLPVIGDDKRHALQRAWSHLQNDFPVSHVLHQTQTPVALWVIA